MGIGKSMTGTPWHNEVLKMDSHDSRRHKSNCVYYQDNQCRFYIEKCRGSAHCDAYKQCERHDEKQSSYSNSVIKKKRKPIHKNPANGKYPDICELIVVGDEIKERYYTNGIMKTRIGTVIKVDDDTNKVTIEFKNRKGKPYWKAYSYPDMMKDIFIL